MNGTRGGADPVESGASAEAEPAAGRGFLQRRGPLALAVLGVLGALAIRWPLLPFESPDARNLFVAWDFLVANGFDRLRYDIHLYNPPYFYLLAGASAYLSWLPDLFAIKSVSIVFDFLLAFFVGKCVGLRSPESKMKPVLAGLAALFAPTVVMNSAMWGQADAIYTAFLVACLYFLLAGRQVGAFAAFGLAVSVKLQAVFLAPLFLWLLAKRAVDWRSFLATPVVWFSLLLPAWFLGRPLVDLLLIYVNQAGRATRLTMQAPNLYMWLPESWYDAYPLFSVLAAGVVVAAAFVVRSSRARLTPGLIVFLASFSVLLMPFILPKMHDRYFFPAEVLSIVLAFWFPRFWYAPVVLGLVSTINYIRYLHEVLLFPLPWLAVALAALLVVLGRRLWRMLDPSWERAPEIVRRGGAAVAGLLGGPRRAPLVALGSCLVTVILLGSGRGGFLRAPPDDPRSFDTLARAASISPEHGFARFSRRTLDREGAVVVEWDNRLPLGGDGLLALVTAPFRGRPAASLEAARWLMIAFFGGILFLAYSSLRRLLPHRWIAFAATLLAFSAYAWRHGGVVATEGLPALFGVMLCFRGLVVFVREDRFRPAVVGTGFGLLLGWQTYALLLPFVALRMTAAGRRRTREVRALPAGGGPGAGAVREGVRAAFRSRVSLLGVFALGFGAALSGLNAGSEHFASSAERRATASASVGAVAAGRAGPAAALSGKGDAASDDSPAEPEPVLRGRLRRIGALTIPFAFTDQRNAPDRVTEGGVAAVLVGVGALATLAALVGAFFVPHGALLAVLGLSGFCGLALWPATADSDLEALYHFGIPLAFFSLGLLLLRRYAGGAAVPYFAAFAVGVFLVSRDRVSAAGYDAPAAALQERVHEDFEAMRRFTEGGAVFVPGDPFAAEAFGGRNAVAFYLPGSVLVERPEQRGLADFVVGEAREPERGLLTRANREFFLYDRAAYDDSFESLIREAGAPAIRSRFEVYRLRNWLVYVRDGCDPADREDPFFLHIRPVDRRDLTEERQPHGFDNLDFDFADYAVRGEGRCLAAAPLPVYEIGSIRTGQFRRRGDGSYEQTWRGESVR